MDVETVYTFKKQVSVKHPELGQHHTCGAVHFSRSLLLVMGYSNIPPAPCCLMGINRDSC